MDDNIILSGILTEEEIERKVFLGGMITGEEIERQIRLGNIEIDPFDKTCINPNSYNLKLYPELITYSNDVLDMHKDNPVKKFTINDNGFILMPNPLYLGRTVERCKSDKFIPMINGRSSGGRLGLSIHVCAGFGDIGFNGTWTLEITVVEPLKIYPYEEAAQVCYFTPYGNSEKLYRGRYYNQEEATPSRFFQGKLKEEN